MPTATPGDTLVYTRADGTQIRLVPKDQRPGWPTNRGVARVMIVRPDAPLPGEWVPEGSPEILLPPPPAPPPAPPSPPFPPPPPPTVPTDGPLVEPGQSWADALRSAESGQTVYLRAGAEYVGGLADPAVRLQSGVKLAAWPAARAKATVRVPQGSALCLWAAAGFVATDVRFVAGVPTEPGVRFTAGCRNVALVRCEVAGFTFGVTSEGTPAARNAGVTLDRCHVHDNWHPANQDSSGLYAGKTDGLTLAGNLFAHNGWRDGDPVAVGGIRSHNAYVAGDCGPATVADNLFARASSHGLQARSGGVVRGNWFVDNPIHLSVGLVNGGGPVVKGGVTATVTANTFSGTRPLAGSPRGWGVEVSNAKDVTIAGNTFARDGDYDPKLGNVPAAIKVDVCKLEDGNPSKGDEVTVVRLRVSDNACRWPFANLWRNPHVPAAGVTVDPQWGAADVATVAAAAGAALARMRSAL